MSIKKKTKTVDTWARLQKQELVGLLATPLEEAKAEALQVR